MVDDICSSVVVRLAGMSIIVLVLSTISVVLVDDGIEDRQPKRE